MNTPAHLVINLALLGGGARKPHAGAISVGALLPDLPMFGFFLWERFALGLPGRTIWGEHYFDPGWQQFFDVFNSMPLALAGLAVALSFKRVVPAVFFGSVLLHCLLDFPLHREDGHRHFFPFSDWRFMSPVSYWDPAHLGTLGSGLETGALCVAGGVLWRRHPGALVRVPLVALAALSVAGWVAFYGFGLLPDFE